MKPQNDCPAIACRWEGKPREVGLAQGRALRQKIAGVWRSLRDLEAFYSEHPRWLPYLVSLRLAEARSGKALVSALRRDSPAMLDRWQEIAAGARPPQRPGVIHHLCGGLCRSHPLTNSHAMKTTPILSKSSPRRWASSWLSGSLVVLAALTAKADTTTKAQALSVASTWPLPVEVKAVWFALSPDAESLALMRTNGDVEIWSTASRQPQRTIAAPTRPPNWFFGHSLAFSPDGQWLAILNGGPLRLIPLSGATNELVIGDARDRFMRIKFSGDSRRLLVSGRTEYVVSLPEGKLVSSFVVEGPAKSGRPVLRPLSQFGTPSRPTQAFTSAISPDGSEVALGQKHWEVERWDVATGQCLGFVSLRVPGLPPFQSPISVLNYSSRNKQLVAVLDGNQWDVALVEPDGKWRTLLHQTSLGQKQTSPRRAINDAFFTPDGREVVVLAEKLDLGNSPQLPFAKSVGPEVQFLDTATETVTRRLEGRQGCFFSQVWISADGQRLTVLQRSYSMVPRTHAERQGPHLYQADLAAALLTVPLERQPKAGKP